MNKTTYILMTLLAFSAFIACGKTNPDPNTDPAPEPGTLPSLIFSQDFTKGKGSFKIEDKAKGKFTGDIWKFDAQQAQYGLQASGADANNKNYAVESWLVSPEIDLTKYNTDIYLYFHHAFAFVKKGSPKDYLSVKVTADGGATWVGREIPKWLVDHSYYELAQSGNLPLNAYKGKKIQIAFVYTGTEECAPTWEITDMTVSTERQELLPDDQGDQYTSVPGWMELPQVKDASAWHAHTAILRFQRVRNYSFSYNQDALLSDWVAYPLYDLAAKSRVTRYDKVVSTNQAWQADPFLSKCADVRSSGSYKWSAGDPVYSRGHQLPSADRLGGAMVNMQTFYTSNVTPQNSTFNGGVWARLEDAVRDWSSSSNSTDTLYVVTGCIVDAGCQKVSDHVGNMVAIPKAYYKALLRLSKGKYIGAGFYFEHQVTSKEYKDFACSLKELEEKTGLTFFANLPAETATKVKAEKPKDNAFWNLK